MHLSADPVPDEFPYDREPFAFDIRLHGAGDDRPGQSRPNHLDRQGQRLARYIRQPTDVACDVADQIAFGGVAAPPVQFHAEIHADQIAVANHTLRRRNAVDDLIVQRATDIARERPGGRPPGDALEQAASAVLLAQPFGFDVQFFSCHARSDDLSKPVQHQPDNVSSLSHLVDLLRRLIPNRHEPILSVASKRPAPPR